MESLDLSDNRLTGEIPAWEGDFYSLRRVDLSGNQLSGEIPSWLSGSGELRWLDLGGNQLSGEIPAWTDSFLLYLERLVLGDNRLTGQGNRI